MLVAHRNIKLLWINIRERLNLPSESNLHAHMRSAVDKAMHPLGELSLLLPFDKYNFKRSSQTALAGRLHNEHNNSPPPWELQPSSFTLAKRCHVCMCTCVFVSLRASRRLPTFCSVQSGCIEEPFGSNFSTEEMHPPPSPPFYLPLACNA